MVFSLGPDPSNPILSIKSTPIDPFSEIPFFDVPLSRDFLAVSASFHLVLFDATRGVLGLSSTLNLADQSLRVDRKFAISGGFFIETRIQLYPADSLVVRSDLISGISSCGLCVPRLPGRTPCGFCGGAGRLGCAACLDAAQEISCVSCGGCGYRATTVVGISAQAAGAPVFQRAPCGDCAGVGSHRCPVCDGLGSGRCHGCAGHGHLRCRCAKEAANALMF